MGACWVRPAAEQHPPRIPDRKRLALDRWTRRLVTPGQRSGISPDDPPLLVLNSHADEANSHSLDRVDDAWAPLRRTFVSHYETLRGAVRTQVLHEHLKDHLRPPPAALVDVGGGAGHQAIPLAREGYEVTIIEPSPAMLAAAEEALHSEPPEVAARLSLIEATGEAAPELLGARRFDGVLCHGVTMYLDDPGPLISAVCALAAPGGVVSIVAKNARTLAVRPALAGDWHTALDAFDTDRQINGLGVNTRGDTIEGLSELLTRHGVTPVAWYGVRLFTDGWTPEHPPIDDPDTVLAVELEASRRDPYRQLSRLFHLVGTRR